MKQYLDQLEGAINRKQSIIAQKEANKVEAEADKIKAETGTLDKESWSVHLIDIFRTGEVGHISYPPYYKLVKIGREVRHSDSIGGGVFGLTKTVYHYEVQCDQQLYDTTVAPIDQSITQYLALINQLRDSMATQHQSLEAELQSARIVQDQKAREANALETQKTYCQAQIEQTKLAAQQLDVQLVPHKAKDARLDHDITQITTQISALGHIKEATSNPISEVDYVVRNLSAQRRAFLLTTVWGKDDDDSREVLDAIKAAGFDVHYVDINGRSLICLAAEKSDMVLFELIVAQDSSSLADDKLLQYALSKSTQEFLTKVLEKFAMAFEHSVQFIIEQDDAASLDKLSSVKPVLIKDSSLYFALDIGSNNVVRMLASKAGVNYEKTLEAAVEHRNFGVFTKLFQLNQLIFTHTSINKQLLLDLATESGPEGEGITKLLLAQSAESAVGLEQVDLIGHELGDVL